VSSSAPLEGQGSPPCAAARALLVDDYQSFFDGLLITRTDLRKPGRSPGSGEGDDGKHDVNGPAKALGHGGARFLLSADQSLAFVNRTSRILVNFRSVLGEPKAVWPGAHSEA
jgi:hypothetical protein